MEFAHLVPGHGFGNVFYSLVAERRTGHIQHKAAHLEFRIIPDDAAWDGQGFPVLEQDLFHGDGSVKASGVGGGIDFQPRFICYHIIAVVAGLIGIRLLGFDIDVVGTDIRTGSGHDSRLKTGNLQQVFFHALPDISESKAGSII